jgi:UDP-N-acetylmuramate dehydrogenase
MTDRRAIKNALYKAAIGKIWYDEPMSGHASLKMGGRADALALIENEDQLARAVKILKDENISFLPVGNLTNLLVLDGGYRGVLLWMRGLDQAICVAGEQGDNFIDAQAGAALYRIVGLAAENELTGLEFCAGIPGSAGGAVWMNAGAYGAEIKDVISTISVIDGNGKMEVLRREEIGFAYRQTNLPKDIIICGVRLALQKGKGAPIRERMAQIIKWRQQKHPLQYPSAGSVFKNQPGAPAGRLIEELGLKGLRRGDVQVSKMHANFIINKGQGRAADMVGLIEMIKEKAVKEKGIALETEIVIIGENG